MSKDIELSCDEIVLKKMGSKIKADYSQSLLNLPTNQRDTISQNSIKVMSSSPIYFGENNTKRRIINIMNYKKPSVWITAICVLAIIVIAIGFMTNSKTTPAPVAPLESSETLSTPDVSTPTSSNSTSIDFENFSKKFTLTIEFPEFISQYITLREYEYAEVSAVETNIAFDYKNGDSNAAIGIVTLYKKDAYEILDPQAGPVPTKLFEQDDFVVAFQGLQSQPFEYDSADAKLVDEYQKELKNTISSIRLTIH